MHCTQGLADDHAHFDDAHRHRPAGQPVTDTVCDTDNLVVLIIVMMCVLLSSNLRSRWS